MRWAQAFSRQPMNGAFAGQRRVGAVRRGRRRFERRSKYSDPESATQGCFLASVGGRERQFKILEHQYRKDILQSLTLEALP
jgi:hypothetical protein